MLSKVFNSSLCGLFKFQPTIISTGYGFCTAAGSRHQGHPLRNKIMNISSLDEFNTFIKDKSKQFDPSCYSVASRTLAKILIDSKLYLTFQNRESIKNFLTQLQKIDIDALTLQQFSQLLYLLRIIKTDINNNNAFVNQYIKLILERSDKKIKQLELETSLNRLSYFYQEYSSLGAKQASVIAKRINSLLQTNNSEVQFQTLAVSEINSIIKGMKVKAQISSEEQTLFRTIVKTVIEKHFEKLSFFELAQISVGINEIVQNSNNQIVNPSLVEQIHKKVFTNIDEMDEKSIMFILNAKKTSNRTYNQIYKTIFEKILDEIQPSGESSFNELFTLRLFNGISDKVRLSSATPQNQEKFFSFLKVTLTKTPRFIHSFVESFIQKGFFNYKQLLRVQEILELIPDFNLKLTLIYELSKRGINIEKLISAERLKDIDVKDRYLILMISIFQKLAEKEGAEKQFYVSSLEKLKARFFELYKAEDDTFGKFVNSLSPELIETLYQTLRKDIDSKLPNPFETEQSPKYRIAWLKVYIHGCSQLYFNKRLVGQLKDKLNEKDIENILRTIAIDGYANKQALSNTINLISKRIDLVIAHENLVFNMVKLFTNQIFNIFSDRSSDMMKSKFWHIMSDCIEKLPAEKFFQYFSSIVTTILRSKIYDFRYSSQYQSFLNKLLQRSENIKNKYLAVDLLDECLRLNLIKREHIQNLSKKLTESATNSQTLLLKMIESNNFALEGVELTKSNLYMFFFNLSPETSAFINTNQDKIISLIEQMKPHEIWKCISHFRLGSKRTQTAIFEALFKQINKYTLMFEEFSPVFLAEILRRNHFEKYNIRLDNVKTFYKNSLEYFVQKRNIYKIPLEDHVELIRAANEVKVRNDEYVHALFEQHYNDLNIFKRELYLVAGHIGIELNKKEIQKLIDHNFFVSFSSSFSKSFNIFIYNEKQLENPGTHLKTIINKYNELKVNEKVPIYSTYYQYLKKVYPEETKDFEPNHVENADFCRSIESFNNKTISLFRQLIEEVTQQKFVENNIFGNYYYTFRNIAIIFPIQSKFYGENNVIKRILSTLTGIEKFALLNKRQNNVKSAVKYLTQSFNGILTVEEEEKIIKRADQKYQQSKETQGEPEAAEEAEQKPTTEQTKTQ